MDQIIIKGLKIFGYHGVNPDEKLNGQSFIIDVIIDIKKNISFTSDDIKDTLNYSAVVKNIIKSTTSTSFNLIEKCAETIAESLILNFEDIVSLEVTVKKPEAPIKENFEYVGVKITRVRNDYIA